jgi:peptide deformylase
MQVTTEGFFAWVLQYEIEHLEGIISLDRPEDVREIRPGDFAEEEAVVE